MCAVRSRRAAPVRLSIVILGNFLLLLAAAYWFRLRDISASIGCQSRPRKMSMAICWFSDEGHLRQCLISAYSVSLAVHSSIYTCTIRIFIYNWTHALDPLTQAKIDVIRLVNPMLPVVVAPFDMRLTERIPASMEIGYYSWVMVARLFVTRLVNEDLIFYLDGDTICGRDFTEELQPHLLPPKLMYAALDIGLTLDYMIEYFKSMQFDLDHYINTGVMLMRNGPVLDTYLQRVILWANRHANVSRFPDQDGINIEFGAQNIGILPKTFNCHYCVRRGVRDVVIHHGKRLRVWRMVSARLTRLAQCRLNCAACAANREIEKAMRQRLCESRQMSWTEKAEIDHMIGALR
jgi:lipopolysaccharide biosynthesis glycosyltransferase